MAINNSILTRVYKCQMKMLVWDYFFHSYSFNMSVMTFLDLGKGAGGYSVVFLKYRVDRFKFHGLSSFI